MCAAVRAAQGRHAAHDRAVNPDFFNRFLDDEGIELVTRRRVVRDELRLTLEGAAAVHQRVIVGEMR
jgi:hypothetical protein